MENWRDKSERDNLVVSPTRNSDSERYIVVEKRLAELAERQRSVPSWFLFASVFALASLGAVLSFLALYNSENLEARLVTELENRISNTEQQIKSNTRSIVEAITKIENSSASREDNIILGQLMLKTLGYDVEISGTLDAQTVDATREFQKDRGINEDGILGAEVRGELKKAIQQ